MQTRYVDRRVFLRASSASLLLSSSTLAGPTWLRNRPSDELRVAVVGVRGRGRNHIAGFQRLEGVQVAVLVDVDRAMLEREQAEFAQKYEGEAVEIAVDLRTVLERDDIDIISIASPNHWHALQAIWSCQAGKDVYLEKPVSHNVWEGGQIVAAARKYGRIVQTGTQCRSSEGIAQAIEWLQGGGLGEIRLARGLCYKPRRSIGKVDGDQVIDPRIDYDLWTGPAPLKPLHRQNLHYDWHWDSDTGNGDLGNQGIHQMDIARWAVGASGLPTRVRSMGGRLGYDDDGNTANTQVVLLEYERAPVLFEVRGLPTNAESQATAWEMDRYLGARIGVLVHCEKGVLRVPNYSSAQAIGHDGETIREFEGASDHYANFIAAVRSRKISDLAADIQEGHVSSSMCHIGNVSQVLGQPLSAGEIAKELESNIDLSEAFHRMSAHLRANGVDVDQPSIALGPWIDVDPQTGSLSGAEGAAERATRDYRQPFSVPASV